MIKVNTMLPINILNALKVFYNKIKDTNIPWILSGSTALAIQGVDVIPNNDIDILTTQQGAKQIDALLSDIRIQPPDFSETDKYKSYFGIYKIDNVTIEIMGEFQYKLKNGSWARPNQDNKIIYIEYEGMTLPTLTLEQEFIEYENMGRTDKVKKINNFLNSED